MNLSFDPLNQKYSSRRYPIYAVNGMVNCSNPLAASAGLSILQKGGNAMDAAVAAAAALTVVEPTSNGIGSDAFALIWSEKNRKLFGINSSGRAPMLAAIDKIKDEGKDGDQQAIRKSLFVSGGRACSAVRKGGLSAFSQYRGKLEKSIRSIQKGSAW